MNLKETIFAAEDIKKEAVKVPEWGVTVYIKTLTGRGRDMLDTEILDNRGKGDDALFPDVRAKLVSWTACDEEGKLIFDKNDIEKLSMKSGKALDRLFEVAQRMSGITDSDIEEMEKK